MSQYHFVMIVPSENTPMRMPSSRVSFASRENLAEMKGVEGANGAWQVNIQKNTVNKGVYFVKLAGTHRRKTVRRAPFALVGGFQLKEAANVVPAS